MHAPTVIYYNDKANPVYIYEVLYYSDTASPVLL